MVPITSYEILCNFLTRDIDYWRHRGLDLNIRLCAILFARPQSELASREIFPELEYFNTRLGPRLHVFVAGCTKGPAGLFPDDRPVGRTGQWKYSDVAFDRLRRDLELRTRWRYQEGCELLLFNATFARRTRVATVDFGSAVRIDLDRLRALNGIPSVARLIGQMADYCDHSENRDDPAWGFSDLMGGNVVRASLWHLLLSFIPESIRNDADAAREFVMADLRKV